MKPSIPPTHLALLMGLSFSWNANAQDSPIQLDETAIENLHLEYATAKPRALGPGVQAPGAVRLNEQRVVEVTARIAGVVHEDFQTLGAPISQGDKLFTLESADLSEAIMAYIDAEQAMTFAHTALGQEKKLVEKNLSSKEQLQQKELAFQQSVAGHERALQPLKLLHFNEGSIHKYLNNVGAGNYTTLEVKAPTSGEVIEKSVRLGAAVDPEETLYTIADLSELWVDFQVALRSAQVLSNDMEVSVSSSVSDQQRTGKVVYIAPLADEASRTVLVRAILKNDDRAWRPGTPVTVEITGNKGEATLAVPVSAVVDFEGEKAVFVKTGETSFAPTPIETGSSDGEFIQVRSGLSAGDEVVSQNAAQLKGHLEMTAGE